MTKERSTQFKEDGTALVSNVGSVYGLTMQGPVKERWQHLCEQAANEQDPTKLLELVREINDLLLAKQNRLNSKKAEGSN